MIFDEVGRRNRNRRFREFIDLRSTTILSVARSARSRYVTSDALTGFVVIVCLVRSEAHCALSPTAGSGSKWPSFVAGLKGYHIDLSKA